jgi:hypothetical protein
MMIDLADLLRGLRPEDGVVAKARLSKMGANVAGFAAGCAAGAILFSQYSMWCFAAPPLLALAPVLLAAKNDPGLPVNR